MAGVAGGGTDSYGQARTAIRREEARGEELCICSRTVSHHTHSTLVWRQEVEPEEELQRAITLSQPTAIKCRLAKILPQKEPRLCGSCPRLSLPTTCKMLKE